MALSRRAFLTHSASLGAALAALAAVPGPVAELLGDAARAATGELSAAGLRTFVAVCEAVCSFDGRTPPPARVDGLAPPTARGGAGARPPPPIGAASLEDLVAYRERSFSELDVPLRLRFVRSWARD